MTDQPLTEAQRAEIIESISAGQKIQAIKQYREASGEDLKASKEFVERLIEEMGKENPDILKAHEASGCLGLLIVGLVTVTTICGLKLW